MEQWQALFIILFGKLTIEVLLYINESSTLWEATALALQKVRVKSLVLRRANKLRYEGTSISLFTNAWRALDVLGVSHKLESLYQPFEKGQVTNFVTGIRQDILVSSGQGNGARAVHRKVLIESLAEELPPDSIRFSSKLVSIKNKVLKDSSNVT